MSDEKNTGGSKPESQAVPVQDLITLAELLKGAATLPSQLAEDIAAFKAERDLLTGERQAIAAERDSLSKERTAFNLERQSDEALRKQLLGHLASAVETNNATAARESKKDAVVASLFSYIEKIEANSADTNGVIKAIQLSQEALRMDLVEANKLAMAIDATVTNMDAKVDVISSSIEKGFSDLNGSVDSVQNSVDRVGLILNRVLDMVTHIRDLSLRIESIVLDVGTKVAAIKKDTFDTMDFFHGLMAKKVDHLPELLQNQITSLTSTSLKLKNAADGFIKQGKAFSNKFEEDASVFNQIVSDLKELYGTHTRRLNDALERELSKLDLESHFTQAMNAFGEMVKKSGLYDMLGKIESYKEALDFSLGQAKGLLSSIQQEELSFAVEAKAATDVIRINAHGIHESFLQMTSDVRESRAQILDATTKTVDLVSGIEKTREKLINLSGTVNTLLDLSTSASMTVSEKYLDEINKLIVSLKDGLEQHISTEISALGTNKLLNTLEGNEDK